jgi:hypothetical protein
MNKLQKFCAASLLISTLSPSAFAGQIEIGVAPPDSSAQGEMSTTADGTIHTGVAGDMHTGNSDAADARDSAAGVVGLVVDVLSSLF